MSYFVAHRALADVEAMRDVLFCTQLKDLSDRPLEQKNKYKSMVKIRDRTQDASAQIWKCNIWHDGQKIATEGFDFPQLQNLRATLPDKDKFMQFLRSKGLSPMCSQKLVTYFFQP